MSRIGNKVIVLPAGVELTNNDNVVTVKGPKGELTRTFSKDIEIRVEGTEVTLHRPNDSKEMKTIHGTTRALLNNMVTGVSEGFKKELEMRGVGYRAQLQGSKLVLAVGKSHPDEVEAPEGITFELPNPTTIGKLSGTADRPRLNVFRSNTGIYAQVIDDVAGVTLASASTLDKEVSKGTKTEQAVVVGKLVAERAVAKGISEVVFDRGGYLYHGRVKALADAARENGLKF